MPLDYFDSRTLTGVITRRPMKPSLITALFFSPQVPSYTDKFELHVETVKRRVLPIVSNGMPAEIVEGREGKVLLAKAPRIRVKRPFAAEEVLKNLVGMNPYDTGVNPVEVKIAKQLQDFRDDTEYTIEFMCAQLATQGKLTMKDKENSKTVVTYELDLQRNPNHIVDNSASGKKWNGSSGKILDDVTAWNLLIAEATGRAATDLVLGSGVVSPFINHPDVKGLLDNRSIAIGQLAPSVQTLFLGTWNGLNVWMYPYKMTDRTNTTAPLLAADSVLLGTSGAGQDIEWGIPLDRKCEGPTDYFVKTYEEEDPSQTWVLMETRPLPWTKNPDAFVTAKVVS